MVPLQAALARVRLLWAHHKNEIIAAIVIGIPVAAYFALVVDRSEPSPYNLYIVASPRTEEEALNRLQKSAALQGLEIQGIKILPNVIRLEDDSPEAATAKARYILRSEERRVGKESRSQ